MATSHPLQGVLLVGSLVCLVSAITNSQELARYQQLSQFRNYPEELTRAALSPQQQSHILSDVQQHRFLVNQGQRQQNYQQVRPSPQIPPQLDYQPVRQQPAYQTIGQNPQQIYEQQNYQPFQPQTQQGFNSYQPQPQPQLQQQPQIQQQPQVQNYQNFNYQQPPQPERKPILLQPTYPKDEATNPPATQTPSQAPAQANYRQPSYRPQQPSNDNYQQQFENYVVPERQKDYIAQVDPPKNIASYTPEPQKEDTPAWILETQPPTPYKSQKPYDAITFGTESYKITTTAPRFIKYRPKTKPTADPPVSKDVSSKEDTSQIYIKPDRKKLFDQLVSSQTTPRPKVTTPSPTVARSTTKSPKSDDELLQEELQRQIQAQLSGKDDVFGTLKITLPGSLTSEQIANLPNLALGDKIDEYQIPTVFPNTEQKSKTVSKPSKGKPQVKVIVQQPHTTVKPPTLLFEELTKGVLPAGADFELIRQNQDGGLEEVGKLKDIPQKKVTFVILEEQPDGSVKVQGVRGNEDGSTETKGEEVDSIIQKIQKGEIKLPPSAKKNPTPSNNTPDESVASPSYIKHVSKNDPPKRRYSTKPPTVHTTVTVNSHSGPYQSEKKETTKSKPAKYQGPTRSTFLPTLTPSERPAPVYKSTTTYTTTRAPFHESHYAITASKTTPSSQNEIPSSSGHYDHPPTGPAVYDTPTTQSFVTTQSGQFSQSPVYQATPGPEQYSSLPAVYNNLQTTGQFDFPTPAPSHFTSAGGGSSVLTETLKKNGFFAMAKFLRQSGLETVLNETGPYTLFVPTDRAFRSLLVQLGGPDRAEIKFKENPRLLSGLLLHHVIPGSFKLDSLQDEMTGVSLAGTQLRVNTYVTQDPEWNDIKVTTINGAKVLREKADVVVPQGVAHGVDRVMFPLPVGDVLQTLQADREGRFSRFVRLLRETGVASMLTGSKTYTVFAPTDAAFPEGEVERLLENRASARALVLRHLTPGTLYSAGMLFYQLRDSMSAPNQIQLSKEAGRVKVNNAHVVSRNIPSTNGVIHAVDSLL